MERSIEFRGKVINEIILNGRVVKEKDTWVYGGFTDNIGGTFILQPDSGYGFIQIKTNPETIGQYTGLKDKNGTKIFEGDIVKETKDQYSKISVVKFSNVGSCGCCYPQFIGSGFKLDDFSLRNEYWEVIGNIYDNPELLEKGE